MQDEPNNLDGRVGQLDQTVERLTSEVTSLKLELATMVSALRELQHQHPVSRRIVPPVKALPPVPRPSMTPAAIVVLFATVFLSWQLIATPNPPQRASEHPAMPVPPPAPSGLVSGLTLPLAATEPPVTPLVRPTIYKGTLAVNAPAGATVFVNRQNVGTAPVRIRNLRAGAHLVWVESEGYRRWTRVITVPAERITRVSAELEPIEVPVEH